MKHTLFYYKKIVCTLHELTILKNSHIRHTGTTDEGIKITKTG